MNARTADMESILCLQRDAPRGADHLAGARLLRVAAARHEDHAKALDGPGRRAGAKKWDGHRSPKIATLEKRARSTQAHAEFGSEHFGHYGAQGTLYVVSHKDAGRSHQQTFTNTYTTVVRQLKKCRTTTA